LETFWGREDYIAKEGEVIRRFLAAMDDTADWIRTSPEAPGVLARFIGFTYPEGPDDVKQALKEVDYPKVSEHKAKLAALLAGLEPLADDALERKLLPGNTAKEIVEQLFDTRYVQ